MIEVCKRCGPIDQSLWVQALSWLAADDGEHLEEIGEVPIRGELKNNMHEHTRPTITFIITLMIMTVMYMCIMCIHIYIYIYIYNVNYIYI